MIALGLELTVIGMGAVFAFLLFQVFCMSAVAAFFKKFDHLFSEPVVEKLGAQTKTEGDEALAVAIAFARAKSLK